MESTVAHGKMETLDKFIDDLTSAGDTDFLFHYIMRHYDQSYREAGMFWDYFYGVTAVSLCPEGISESDIMEAFDIPLSRWSIVRPGVMRFCKGTPERMLLVRRSWNHQVKMYWSTHIRAQTGKQLSDWYLAEPDRKEKNVKKIASIYHDIWHLPFAYKDDLSSKKLYFEYQRSIYEFCYSSEAVMNLSSRYYSYLSPLIEHVPEEFPSMEEIILLISNRVSMTDYYTRLYTIFRSNGWLEEIGTIEKLFIEALSKERNPYLPLYEAYFALESGQPKKALEILKCENQFPDSTVAQRFYLVAEGKSIGISVGVLKSKVSFVGRPDQRAFLSRYLSGRSSLHFS